MASKSISQYTDAGTTVAGDKYLIERSGKYYYMDEGNLPGGGTEFADDVFRIQDNADATKELAFEVSAIGTGTTRTWTIADRDMNLSQIYATSGFLGVNQASQVGTEKLGIGGNVSLTESSYFYVGTNQMIHYTGDGALNFTNRGNMFVGYNVGTSVTGAGIDNSGFGSNALASLTTGTKNSAFGESALNTAVTTNNASAFGWEALKTATGNGNTAFGRNAGEDITSGANNTCVGAFAMWRGGTPAFTGSENTAIGYTTGFNLTGGNYNTYIGTLAGRKTTGTNSYSMGIGYKAYTNASQQCVLAGSDLGYINDYVFGVSPVDAGTTARNIVFRLGSVSGTNQGGHSLHLKSGLSTGNSTTGGIEFYTTNSGGSGSTENTYTKRMSISGGSGIINMTLPTSSAGLSAGDLWNNSGVVSIV